jgi:gentisate 1,2-dioxygenase
MINKQTTIKKETDVYKVYEHKGQQYINNVLCNVVYEETFHKPSWESTTTLISRQEV